MSPSYFIRFWITAALVVAMAWALVHFAPAPGPQCEVDPTFYLKGSAADCAVE